jgi:4-amino-4-deoxy-L-arabinose transferase-like glycosyltransferase
VLKEQPKGAVKRRNARPLSNQPLVEQPQPAKYHWDLLLGTFLIALCLRCAYLWQISSAPFFDLRLGDGQAYHEWARRIAAGDWIGQGVFYQAPLYPYFLALIYKILNDSTLTVRVIQAFVGAVSCTLLAAAGISLFGRRGAMAGVLLMIYPPAIYLDGLIEKSALITLFTTGLLALLAAPPERMTKGRWLATGATLGLLALTRENALLLVLPILLWIAFGPLRQRLGPALLFLAGCGMLLLPVGLRNLVAGGEFHLTTSQFGSNFYIGNHAGADGTYQPFVAGHGNVIHEREDATLLAQQAVGRSLSPAEVSSFWTKRAFAYITAQPINWLALTGRKLALTFNAAELWDTESQDVYAEWSWLLRILRPFDFGLLLGLSALGVVLTARDWRRLWFLYALGAVYAFSTVLFYVFARYRFPVVPVLMLLAAGGLRQRWMKQLIPAVPIAVLMLLFAHIPLIDTNAGRAVNYLSIANALAKHPERREQAAEFYQRTLAEDPRWPPAHCAFGLLLNQTGRPDEAAGHFQAALAVWPDYAEAHYLLGQALTAGGHTAEGLREYGEALRLGYWPGR